MGTRNADLVVYNLIKRTAFVEKRIEFDDVRVLGRESDRFVGRWLVVGGETDRSGELVGGPVEAKHDHSRFACGRVGGHDGEWLPEGEVPSAGKLMNVFFVLHIGEGIIQGGWAPLGGSDAVG